MYFKILAIILLMTLLGLQLLNMRQQRLEIMHDMAGLHRQLDRTRQKMWQSQVAIAVQIEPSRLRAAIERTDLHLDPTVVVLAASQTESDLHVTDGTP